MDKKPSFRDKKVNAMIKWNAGSIILALTTWDTFLANPEAAFGVVRKLITKNKLRLSHAHAFLNQHPAWAQCQSSVGNGANPNEFYTTVANSDWGKKNIVHATFQKSGQVSLTWEDKVGTKTATVHLSMEMVGYGTDTRTFNALTMGGSKILSHFVKDGSTVNMDTNNDHDAKRFVLYGDRLEETRERQETNRAESNYSEGVSDDNFLDSLMSGETMTLGSFN
jgi:hypothetical protein